MLQIAMFLGVCIAIYAIFSYLEARLIRNIVIDVTMEYLKENGYEIMPLIIEDVTRNITNIFIENIDELATLDALSAIKEVIKNEDQEEITETGEKDNQELAGD